MAFPLSRSRSGFSFWDALLLIAILAFLVILLRPAVHVGMDGGEHKTQTKNDVVQLAVAINAYAAEYGHLPISEKVDVTISDDDAQSHLLDILSVPDPKSPPPENPRGIVFIEIPKAKGGRSGRVNGTGPYRDPWGNAYFIALDGDGNGWVPEPGSGSQEAIIRKTVLVWSRGKPSLMGSRDDPKKWVKSWE